VVTVTETGGPGLTDPRLGPGVIRHERVVLCGHEYQEGATASTWQCACGTFAIGRCRECGDPVCGDHSQLWADVRLCSPHAAAAAAERAAQAREREATAQAEEARRRERITAEWLAGAHEVLAGLDPTAQLICVVGSFAGVTSRGAKEFPAADWDAIRRLLPERFENAPAKPGSYFAPWDTPEVVEYFVRHVRAPPDELQVTMAGFFGVKRRRRQGWWFREGSSAAHPSTGTPQSVAILSNGSVYSPTQGGERGFNARALREMLELLDLPKLPNRPRG
jgi:hypothetical protein